MEKLEVLVTDFENNPRQKIKDKINKYELEYIDLVMSIMGDLEIQGKFENYVIITHTGEEITYTYSSGASGISGAVYSPGGKGKELENQVGDLILKGFANPFILRGNKKFLGIKVGEWEQKIYSDIYPNNTLLVIDKKFEKAALEALGDLGIETHLNYDYRQPELFLKDLKQ